MSKYFCNCGNCDQIESYDYMTFCHFCDYHICNECVCYGVDEDGFHVELTEDDLKRDENGKFIKPYDYNCDSCNKKKRQIEIIDEILKLVTVKKNIEKCKKLIEELKTKI